MSDNYRCKEIESPCDSNKAEQKQYKNKTRYVG